jgi:hypothetical protein
MTVAHLFSFLFFIKFYLLFLLGKPASNVRHCDETNDGGRRLIHVQQATETRFVHVCQAASDLHLWLTSISDLRLSQGQEHCRHGQERSVEGHVEGQTFRLTQV